MLSTDVSRTLMTIKTKRTLDIFYKKDENGDTNIEQPKEMHFLITNIGVNEEIDF